MINLVKNEFVKIFSRKGIYILFLVFFGYVLLVNKIYRDNYDYSVYDSYNENLDVEIKYAQDELNNIDISNGYSSYYASVKARLENYKLQKEYDEDSWQRQVINEDIQSLQSDYYYALYAESGDVDEAKATLDDALSKLEKGDWRYFVKEKIASLEEELATLKNPLPENSYNSYNNQEMRIKELESSIANLQIRLDEDIPYGDDYLNKALNTKQQAEDVIISSEYSSDGAYYDQEYIDESKGNIALSEYIIENKQDINSENNSRAVIMNFYNEYTLLFLAVILMIGGTIVSSEFNKGTIKNLLIKPYSRVKIILSKYITAILMVLLSILLVLVLQLLIGGLFMDFSSLAIPAVIYNTSTKALVVVNLFKHLFLMTLASLPMLILLLTVVFTISTLFNSSSLAIVLTVGGYFGSAIIAEAAYALDWKIFRIIPTLYWDFNCYLYGGSSTYQYATLTSSTIICLIYWLLLMALTITVFKKRNIKNI